MPRFWLTERSENIGPLDWLHDTSEVRTLICNYLNYVYPVKESSVLIGAAKKRWRQLYFSKRQYKTDWVESFSTHANLIPTGHTGLK